MRKQSSSKNLFYSALWIRLTQSACSLYTTRDPRTCVAFDRLTKPVDTTAEKRRDVRLQSIGARPPCHGPCWKLKIRDWTSTRDESRRTARARDVAYDVAPPRLHCTGRRDQVGLRTAMSRPSYRILDSYSSRRRRRAVPETLTRWSESRRERTPSRGSNLNSRERQNRRDYRWRRTDGPATSRRAAGTVLWNEIGQVRHSSGGLLSSAGVCPPTILPTYSVFIRL